MTKPPYLFNNGYAGGWAWAYTADNEWPSMQQPINNLYTAQKVTIDACPSVYSPQRTSSALGPEAFAY